MKKKLSLTAFFFLLIVYLFNILQAPSFDYSFDQGSESLAKTAFMAGSQGIEFPMVGLGTLLGIEPTQEYSDETACSAEFFYNYYTWKYFVPGNYISINGNERVRIASIETDGSVNVDGSHIITTFDAPAYSFPCDSITVTAVYASDGTSLPLTTISPYISQFGLQGKTYYYAGKFLGEKTAYTIAVLAVAGCMSLVAVGICYLIWQKYNKLLAFSFFCCFSLSPWIVDFSRHLYWVAFTWFLPMLITLLPFRKRKVLVPTLCIYIAIVVKCLCGYEYLPVILISMLIFPILDLYNSSSASLRILQLKRIFSYSLSSILAFITAVLIHAHALGGHNLSSAFLPETYLPGSSTIIDGLNIIFSRAVRNTYSASPELYGSRVTALQAPWLEAVAQYFNWDTQILLGFDGNLFNLSILLAVCAAVYLIYKKKCNYHIVILLLVGFCATFSWFVLAKAHTYVHTYLNFVLWYFGFIQSIIYILLLFIKDALVSHLPSKDS